MNKKIKAFIKELVPIILGILIALFINNWNEDRKDKKYINQMLSSINKELAETNEEINATMPAQISLIDSLDSYLKDDKMSILGIVSNTNGINLPTIKLNTWKAISNSKIELLDYNKVSALANIEEHKEIFKIKTGKFFDFVHSNSEETGRDKKVLLKILVSDIIDTEFAIRKEIEGIINK